MLLRLCKFTPIAILLLSTQAFAAGTTTIQYSLVPLGGNVYRYIYSITNNGSVEDGAPIQLFDTLFDTSLYQESSLQIVTPSSLHSQWSEVLLSGVPPAIPAAYDALALQGGIAAGTTVTGFSVQFTWLGPGVPGVQPFQIYDPTSFQLVQSGQTSSSSLSVPAASTLSLILLGVGLVLTVAYWMRMQDKATPQATSR